MPLHLSYRPAELKQIAGNRETVAALEAVLSRTKDFPHAMLFTGPSGTGKTTLARIVAARLGIAAGDLREMNIANLRGIDSAREIQEQMRLRPMNGRARGFILDEVHMGTKEFFNAMLKPMEDAPEHVYFFLCTTDPAKLLATIKNRCHEFKTEALAAKTIAELLRGVLTAENMSVPDEVLAQICEDAQGSARAALVVLDKIIDMKPADMLEAARRTAAEQNQSIDLCRALIRGDRWEAVAKILAGLGEYEVENLRLAVLGYCQAVLLKGDTPRAWTVLDAFRDPFDRMGRPGVVWACYMCASQQK